MVQSDEVNSCERGNLKNVVKTFPPSAVLFSFFQRGDRASFSCASARNRARVARARNRVRVRATRNRARRLKKSAWNVSRNTLRDRAIKKLCASAREARAIAPLEKIHAKTK